LPRDCLEMHLVHSAAAPPPGPCATGCARVAPYCVPTVCLPCACVRVCGGRRTCTCLGLRMHSAGWRLPLPLRPLLTRPSRTRATQVCAKPPNNKMQPQDWILATVLRFTAATNKYTILDEDDADADPWSGDPSSARQHIVSRRMVLPLAQTEPSVYTPYNEYPKGQWILALYPDTTCFYKALVHTPPSEMAGGPPKAYLVEFEDESEASGKSEPMRVPTKYVMRMADGR